MQTSFLVIPNFQILLLENQLICNLREVGCEDETWFELAQNHVQWWAVVLMVLNLQVLLPESQFISEMDLREIDCEDRRWNVTVSGLCPMVGFAVGSIEWLASAASELVNQYDGS